MPINIQNNRIHYKSKETIVNNFVLLLNTISNVHLHNTTYNSCN